MAGVAGLYLSLVVGRPHYFCVPPVFPRSFHWWERPLKHSTKNSMGTDLTGLDGDARTLLHGGQEEYTKVCSAFEVSLLL